MTDGMIAHPNDSVEFVAHYSDADKVSIPDGPVLPDTDSDRLARIESMVTELYGLVQEIKPAVQRVSADAASGGIAGVMGAIMGMRR